jgi:hypothetical protein
MLRTNVLHIVHSFHSVEENRNYFNYSSTLCTLEEEFHNSDAVNLVKVGDSIMFHAKA